MAIMKDDPLAMEKINNKLKVLETFQEQMKEINKFLRKGGIRENQIATLKEKYNISDDEINRIMNPRFGSQTIGYPQYAITNNGAEIRRLKKRLFELNEHKKECEKAEEEGLEEISFPGGLIVDNIPENRIQIHFDNKPAEDVRSELKHNGFRWAPSNGTWQSYRNHYSMQWAKNYFKVS